MLHRRLTALLSLVLVAVVGFTVTGLGAATAAPEADWSRMLVRSAPGESRADPIPLSAEGEAGPWRITVVEVVTGDAAAQLVTAASQFNDPPAPGFQYVAVRLRVTNGGDRPLAIAGNDFAVTGSSGLVRRFIGAVPPEPAIDGVVAPGATKEGWVVAGAAADEDRLLLLYDSLTLSGNWADRTFALEEGAAIADLASRPTSINRVGRTPAEPAGVGEVIATRDWAIEALEVVEGQAVYDLYPPSDYRTTALADAQGGANVPSWIAFRIRVTNNRVGGSPTFLPPTAFQLAGADGEPIPDVLTLTPPPPDASGAYYPGASREGWVAFERPTNAAPVLVRFLPYRTDGDPRYLSWTSVPTAPAAPAGPLETGMTVVVTADGVRLRAAPSTSADIITQLSQGTELIVTGPATDADGYTWYPVEHPVTGERGYVAADFLRPRS